MCMPKLEYLKKEKTTVNVFVRTLIFMYARGRTSNQASKKGFQTEPLYFFFTK